MNILTTYDIPQNQTTSQDEYRVKIPLWDNKEIRIFFTPDFLNHHFYFPFYRDTWVLVGFNLHIAFIDRMLEWGPRVRLAKDTQGNHLLWGKNEKDETSLRHVYEDNKPVLDLKRVKDKDTELFRMEFMVKIDRLLLLGIEKFRKNDPANEQMNDKTDYKGA